MTSINSIIHIAQDTNQLFVNLQGLRTVLDRTLGYDNIMSDLIPKTIAHNCYEKHYFDSPIIYLAVSDTIAMLQWIANIYYGTREDRYNGIISVAQKIDEITSVLA
jgi:hypothetical protein